MHVTPVVPYGPFALRSDATLAPALTASSAMAVDAASGAVLFSAAPDEQRPIGSITKLMTAMVFLDTSPDLNRTIILTEADRQKGATPHFKTGEQATLGDLLAVMVVASDNDAAMALARSTRIDPQVFIEAMNAKAGVLGLEHTVFADPTGLDTGNSSTAREAIELLRAARGYHELELLMSKAGGIGTAISMAGKKKIERQVKFYTTDSLIGTAYQVVAGKTGYIEESGYCLVALSHDPDGREIYGVVLGSSTLENRFLDMKTLLDWSYQSYIWK